MGHRVTCSRVSPGHRIAGAIPAIVVITKIKAQIDDSLEVALKIMDICRLSAVGVILAIFSGLRQGRGVEVVNTARTQRTHSLLQPAHYNPPQVTECLQMRMKEIILSDPPRISRLKTRVLNKVQRMETRRKCCHQTDRATHPLPRRRKAENSASPSNPRPILRPCQNLFQI